MFPLSIVIPTVLTRLAIGAVSTAMVLFATSASWVDGTIMTAGHFVWDSTNVTNSEYVVSATKVQQTVQHKAGGYNFITNGTQTGAVVQANGVTQLQAFTQSCTSTGGLAVYDTCMASNPLGHTGSLTSLSFDCGGTSVSFVASGSFVKTRNASATATSLIPTKSAGTGSHLSANLNRPGISSGSILWNPADFIKMQVASTVVPKGGLFNCNLRMSLYQPNGL